MSRSPDSIDSREYDAPNETTSLLTRGSMRRARNYQKSRPIPAQVNAPPASPSSLSQSRFSIPRSESTASDHYKERGLISGVQLRLKNVGSVARDHLSSERTFLSYVRTSLALASAGIALMQFLYLGTTTKAAAAPLGAILIIFALLVLFIGTKRFFLVQRTLITGYFPASTLEIALISFFLGSLVTATFVIILMGRSK
ncbi:hypothetical protein CVT26_016154 [Gymnopilus dilepis]|uniref:DUF202 domain-containing protein n=1 Tax=Gymnopilus dilepis TaxID=231916 RepID=A0A409XYZ2_9AGAR|nr:hypothetical protein CVT26_016154 [Gymnopilus dilepis]